MPEEKHRELPELGRRLQFAGSLIAVLFAIGVFGYKIIGGPGTSWMSAVYMTANVLTTAGFRESIPVEQSNTGMPFTVLLFIGAGTVVYGIPIITAFVIEGDLTQGFRRRRMRRAIRELSGHYMVCGTGATGYAVLNELVKTQHSVVAIDVESLRVARVEANFPSVPVLQADFTDDQVLAQAGVTRAEGIVICTTIDKDSLVTTVTARQLNPAIRIIARAANERSVRRTLGDLHAHEETNCLLLAIKDAGSGTYSYNPSDSHCITPDIVLIVLIVMGDPSGVRALRGACVAGVA
jgi:voltage-gated potassium channel